MINISDERIAQKFQLEASKPGSRVIGFLKVLYHPVTTILIILFVNQLAGKVSFNPLTAAQNPRVIFQTWLEHLRELPVNTPGSLSIMLVGSSQAQAIMDFRPGDRLTAQWLAEVLKEDSPERKNRFAVSLRSLANLTMMEFLIMAVDAEKSHKHRPDVLIGGVWLDGMRWIQPRREYVQLANESRVRGQLELLVQASPEFAMGIQALRGILRDSPEIQNPLMNNTDRINNISQAKQAQKLEKWLQEGLEETLPILKARRSLHAFLVHKLTYARNRVLGITTATTRPLPQSFYQINMDFIAMTLKFLKDKGIYTILYIAPMRPIEPNPYDRVGVTRIREELPQLCRRYGAVCLDYSDLIPEALWTVYADHEVKGFGGQPDFAHFTGNAHRLLAEKLAAGTKSLLQHWLAQKIDLAIQTGSASQAPDDSLTDSTAR